MLTLLAAGLLVVYAPTRSVAIGEGNFYKFGPEHGDSVVDSTTTQASLLVDFRFYGIDYRRINVSFILLLQKCISSAILICIAFIYG